MLQYRLAFGLSTQRNLVARDTWDQDALPPEDPLAMSADDAAFLEDSFEDPFGGGSSGPTRAISVAVGPSERVVHALIRPGLEAQDVIDASMLGTFEAMRALASLVRTGFVRMDGITMDVEITF